MRKRRSKVRRVGASRSQHGYALLALIFALMIMAIVMMAAVPDALTQGKREREIEALFRGQEMAEAIARYYAGNSSRIGPAGLVVKTPPPPYGYLTELKKLRDGVSVGNDDVYFVRTSAMIDPLSNEEWDPVRVGDPRIKKFFRAWQESTGRQLPPIYASYMGASANTLDTSDHSKDENGNPTVNTDGTDDTDGADDSDDSDDSDDDEDDEDDSDDEGDEDDSSSLRSPSTEPLFVKAAFQGGFGNSSSNTNSGTIGGTTRGNSNTNSSRNGFKDPGFAFGKGSESKTGPIIGVVSKKKGKSVVSYFGITNYEEMIFIFMPEPQAIVSQPVQPQQQNGQSGISNDQNGDGIPDDVKPNTPTDGGQQQNP